MWAIAPAAQGRVRRSDWTSVRSMPPVGLSPFDRAFALKLASLADDICFFPLRN